MKSSASLAQRNYALYNQRPFSTSVPSFTFGRFNASNAPVDTSAPLWNVRPNIVQSIRAYHPSDLQAAAQQLGHHFLYANLSTADSKLDVINMVLEQFMLDPEANKSFEAVYSSMTDPLHKSGPQPGFVVVLQHIPVTLKFDKEMREQLLDKFRDAADYWADRRVAFRCFYSFL